MRDRFAAVRYDIWMQARRMWEAGLVAASAGNVSARIAGEPALIAITPTSIPYDDMEPRDIVIVDLSTALTIESNRPPSYELPMHRVLYRERDDIGAIVHTHSPCVTTLSVLRCPLPPVIDEMMVHFGGQVEVAEYAFTGTEQIGHNVLRALGDRSAALLANHGNVCIGRDLAAALHVAITMESAARVYVQALQAGTPVPLPESSVTAGRAMFEKRGKAT